jgi:signal transduction histidine kinase
MVPPGAGGAFGGAPRPGAQGGPVAHFTPGAPVSGGPVGQGGPRGSGTGPGLTQPGAAARPATAGPAGTAPRGSRLALSNWRVRWRLIAIIAVPTVAAIILGGLQINSAVSTYSTFQRVENLAKLNAAVVNLAASAADERDTLAGFIAAGRLSHPQGVGVPTLGAVNSAVHATQQDSATVLNLARGITTSDGYDTTVVQALGSVLADINDLTNIREAAINTQFTALAVITRYSSLISDMNAFSSDIANGTSDITLQEDVNQLAALLRAENDASQQRAILYAALNASPPAFPPSGLQTLTQDQEQQTADEAQFTAVASVAEAEHFADTVAGPEVDEAKSQESLAITKASSPVLTIYDTNQAPQDCQARGYTSQASCWFYTEGTLVSLMRQVSGGLVGAVSDRATYLASQALRTAVLTSALMAALIIVVLGFTTLVARSMIRPLRKLRRDALEVAGSRLPDMVRQLSESEGTQESIEIAPIGVASTDEIGEVARAFDQVHREAVRLAADEAMLRGNLNSMFVNLSRRSQSLIERQLTLIDNLEQGEQDPDRLSSLFRLDHLATRMRRNSENLLVLAGHEASRRWSQPVPLVDVLRAAISEIEQYERVVLNVQPGIVVVGQAVNDVVHLVAELVENATTFSPEDTQVYVTGQPLSSGGVLLDITDSGVGVSDQEMAHANWRLDNPPVVDVAVSRRMGLFVVGRLAARHGVRVRLRHAQSGGLTALIWLPDPVAAPEGGSAPLGRLRKFEPEDYGPAPSLSAPPAVAGFAGPVPAGPGGPLGVGGPLGGAPGSGPMGGAPGTGAFGTAPGAGAFGSAPGAGTFGAVPGAGAFGSAPGTGPTGGAAATGPMAGVPGSEGTFTPLGGAPGSGPMGTGAFGLAGDADEPEDGTLSFSAMGTGPASGSGLASRIPRFGGETGAEQDDTADPADDPGQTGPLPIRQVGPSQTNGTGPATDDAPVGPMTTRMPAFGDNAGTNGTVIVNGNGSDTVTVPPAAATGREQRLPIFDSLESDWFRRSGQTLSSGPADESAAQTWSSPADEGWRAARVVAEPSADETTSAGLPKRVPRANLVPGSVGGNGADSPEAVTPSRTAEDIRSRMSSFQRGVREARAAAPQNEEP